MFFLIILYFFSGFQKKLSIFILRVFFKTQKTFWKKIKKNGILNLLS